MLIRNLLRSVRVLSDSISCFRENLVEGIQADEKRVSALLHESLMLVTCLSPHIEYGLSSKVAKNVHKKGIITLEESAMELKVLSEEDFENYVRPQLMIALQDKP